MDFLIILSVVAGWLLLCWLCKTIDPGCAYGNWKSDGYIER